MANNIVTFLKSFMYVQEMIMFTEKKNKPESV